MRSPQLSVGSHRWRHDWRRWTEVVAGFALRRRARRWVRPREYEAMHGSLVAACREQAEADAAHREYYEGLATLVSPWLTTGVLERTDRTLLLDLYERCRLVDHELNGSDWCRVVRAWVPRLLAAVGLVCLLAVGIPVAGEWVGGWLGDVQRSVRLLVGELTRTQQYLAAGIAITLLAMGLLRYGQRA